MVGGWPCVCGMSTSPPQARVVFLHGITSHGGWYDRSCAASRRAAISKCTFSIVVARDSTPTSRATSTTGQRGSTTSPRTWKQLGRELPVVLCGISWGGKLAAAVARRHPGLIQGLGLICPGLYSPHEPGMLKRTALRCGASSFS